MEYVVIRPPIKSVTHPETILAHYVVTRTRIREVINAYYDGKFIVKDEYPPLGVFKVIVGKRKARTFIEAAQLARYKNYEYENSKTEVEEWIPKDNISHVVRCARVCYALKTGRDDGQLYVATNGQFLFERPSICTVLYEYEVSREHFAEIEIGHKLMRYTFNVITQVSTSRELNRVSPNNIAEQSTRYCNYSRGRFEGECAICQPHWFDCMQEEVAYYKYDYEGYCHYIKNDDREWHPYDNSQVVLYKYKQPMLQRYLLDNYKSCKSYLAQIADGMEPQDARGELPLDLATEVVYTYSASEWRHIIDLRYFGKTGAPHPNAKIIAGMIKDKLEEHGYDFG